MIIQIWHGITLPSNAGPYQTFLSETVLPRYEHVAGLEGVYLCRESSNGLVSFLLMSLWSSHEALAQFAGTGTALVTPSPQEQKLLLAFESVARNYEVFQTSEQKEGAHCDESK
jgi:hypothetical protein